MTQYDAIGIVDFFNDTGGYGFIESDQVEEAVFFHMEDIGGPDLIEGTEVAFDVEQAEKGPRAKNVARKSKRAGTPSSRSISKSDQRQTNHSRDASGVVDFFNDTGGYGFIQSDQAEEDVFFHMEDTGGSDLTEGIKVAFDIQQAEKGPRATNVIRDPNQGDGSSKSSQQTSDTKIYSSDQETQHTDTEIYTSGGYTGGNGMCPNCGTDFTENRDVNFCPECGFEISG